MLHHLKGAPFETYDQGQSRRLTHWEQIDKGEMFTATRKFLTLAPIIVYVYIYLKLAPIVVYL